MKITIECNTDDIIDLLGKLNVVKENADGAVEEQNRQKDIGDPCKIGKDICKELDEIFTQFGHAATDGTN